MNFAFRGLTVALCLLSVAPADAWNSVGHRAIAGLAYARLTERARARVDAMMRQFPDYALLVRESSAGDEPKARARAVFMMAAYWPDIIKGDPRFYDEGRGTPTPPVNGFRDMERRQVWHYINRPFSTDGTPVVEPRTPNILTQLRMILDSIGSPLTGQDPAYLLPWLLHLVGDVHQPLHCATRFRKTQLDSDGKPMSDLGGNTVILHDGGNLHSLWDGALGLTLTDAFTDALVQSLDRRTPRRQVSLDPEQWVAEGSAIAERVVYSFGNEGGTKAQPLRLPEEYMARMREVAMDRAALGGLRLATVLNERLR